MMKTGVLIALIIFWITVGGVVGWQLIKGTAAVFPSENSAINQSVQTPSASNSGTPATVALTRTELARHDNSTSCWLLISGNVYDVTNFLPLHPGGKDRILPYCGADATQAFATQGGEGAHSSQATQMLAEYKLGPLQ